VTLDHNWILRLAQNFEKIVITNEIETTELGTFFFKVIIESFLAHV